MKKVLFCASTVSHINNFHLPYLKFFHDRGYCVHVAAQTEAVIPYADRVIGIGFTKSMTSAKNFFCVGRLKRLLQEGQYDIISVHTALAAALLRSAKFLAGDCHSKVCYIVHGYLFLEETPFLKKLPYLLPEVLFQNSCDVVVTMNEEDMRLARKFHLYRSDLRKIDGMGLPVWEGPIKAKEVLRAQLQILPEQTVVFFAGEFSSRKNQLQLIDWIKPVLKRHKDLTVILAGEGETKQDCMQKAQGCPILFPGHVKNINEYLAASDIYLSFSKMEGLPFNIMEAMDMALPVLASRVKGHVDLIEERQGGYLFSLQNQAQFDQGLEQLLKDKECCLQMGEVNHKKVQKFLLDQVKPKVEEIYEQLIQDSQGGKYDSGQSKNSK